MNGILKENKVRIDQSMNSDWKFWVEKEAKSNVCLPHTIMLTPANSSGGRNLKAKCFYEKTIFFGSEYKDKKILIEFEGAMGAAKLFVNDQFVNDHYCGYTPFITDITDYVKINTENKITVEVDNRESDEYPPGKPEELLDFSYDGGLYREACLHITNKTYITNPILANEVAGGGVFVSYGSITEALAEVNVKTQIKNEQNKVICGMIQNRLLDCDGNVAAIASNELHIAADSSVYDFTELNVTEPKLWDVDSPNLYLLETSIICDGEIIDQVITEIGIRSLEFTIDNGTIINGKSRIISGANYHHTYPYIGNAVPNSLLKRDIMKLKEAGMENIRSHYPFSTEFLSFCNQIGMTVIVSNVGWQFYKEGIFAERAHQNMRDIIRWQRNNPSIILWEPILNESRMDFEVQKGFHELVHEEYPYAMCYTASDWGPTDVAYREYDPGMIGKGREEYGFLNIKYDKERPMWIREYGDFPDNFVDQNTAWRTPRGWGDYAMVQCVERMIGRFDITEGTYTKVFNNKKLCGYGTWPGIEHNRGYHINPCFGGYYDLFRVPKFSLYFMQSQVDRKIIGDQLFIANYWCETSPGDVIVYSNAEKVRLYHNDTLVAEQYPDEDVMVAHPPFTFKDVRRNYKNRDRSTLKAQAIVNGEVVKEVMVMSPGVPKKIILEADFMGIPLSATGADIVCVYCKVVDDHGNVVPYAADNHPILFEIEGEGEIIGDESIGANPVRPEGGIAAILVKSTQRAGNIKIRASVFWPQYSNIGIEAGELIIDSIEPVK